MIDLAYPLELITPCMAAGAEPERQAEIRGAALRGQLRWWFRALGGFQSLSPWPATDQEQILFGSMGRAERRMGKLIVRAVGQASSLRGHQTSDAESLGARDPGAALGYLLFPVQAPQRRAVFQRSLPKFTLHLLWRGTPHPLPNQDDLQRDLTALAGVFGHLGSLGFRSRRVWGALAFQRHPPDLKNALSRFSRANELMIKRLSARNADEAMGVLAQWLRKWRSYGRTAGHRFNPFKPGFQFAKNDHDAGRQRNLPKTYRPAIGLPIVQRYSSDNAAVYWNYGSGLRGEGRGRFASPVLLRPYRSPTGQWQALVIFVNTHRWPAGRQVHIDGHPRAVSPDLYEAMQRDPALQPFTPIQTSDSQ
jgi:CRISPR/Cas system CMR-associated protein Cmr1 (group 7 of RAMP superfamily)